MRVALPVTGPRPEGERMPAAQPMLPLPRALPPRARRVRKPFQAGTASQPYRLPHEIRDRLVAALAPYRNREAAYRLAVFLGRFWSMPGRVALPFPIDRQALGLSEARVRGAIKTLEEVGFLARAVTSGSRYRATAQGLHRKPVPFQFGSEYAPLFITANRRAGAARGGLSGPGGPKTPASGSRPSVAFREARPNSPKDKSQAE